MNDSQVKYPNLTVKKRHRLLAQLANFMDDLPSDKLHMPQWASASATVTHCGQAGCAGGWAVSIFHKHGLKLINHQSYRPYLCYEFDTDEDVIKCLRKSNIVKKTLIDDIGSTVRYDGFAAFFGISSHFGFYITSHLSGKGIESYASGKSYCEEYDLKSSNDITPRHVAKRIREVLQFVDPQALEEADPAPAIPQLC